MAKYTVISGIVTAVHDGDNLKIKTDEGKYIPVRLLKIDSPEVWSPWCHAVQPFGPEAGNFLRNLAKGKRAVLSISPNKDQYGRLVASAMIEYDGKMQDAASVIVREGWAWVTAGSGKAMTELRNLMKQAQTEKKGLWAGEKPISPAIWRRRHKVIVDKKQPGAESNAYAEFWETDDL